MSNQPNTQETEVRTRGRVLEIFREHYPDHHLATRVVDERQSREFRMYAPRGRGATLVLFIQADRDGGLESGANVSWDLFIQGSDSGNVDQTFADVDTLIAMMYASTD